LKGVIKERRKINNFARLMRVMIVCSKDDGSTGGCQGEGRMWYSFALLFVLNEKLHWSKHINRTMLVEMVGVFCG
jgi:hypothetical protein